MPSKQSRIRKGFVTLGRRLEDRLAITGAVIERIGGDEDPIEEIQAQTVGIQDEPTEDADAVRKQDLDENTGYGN